MTSESACDPKGGKGCVCQCVLGVNGRGCVFLGGGRGGGSCTASLDLVYAARKDKLGTSQAALCAWNVGVLVATLLETHSMLAGQLCVARSAQGGMLVCVHV